MLKCETCGSEDFEKHEGFLYCSVCQTQSQDYHEQEYDYGGHKVNAIRRKKSQTPSVKTKKAKFYDDGMWTTWEVFNYILYGMTEEIKKCGVGQEFEGMVFKLWAAYLKECQAVFISKYEEKIPKLGFNFKHRDARILYNVDLPTNTFKGRRGSTKSYNSAASFISNSTTSHSKRSIALQRGKLIAADYQDHLSISMQSSNYLADETLESLGKSSDAEISCESLDERESLIKSFKEMLRKRDYHLYKNTHQSDRLLMRAKSTCKMDVKLPAKNKLLSIIHLALLMIGSEIQLSDLLRFIREGHLSFAKVTHFFPKHMKLPKNDFSYIEVTSDNLMPTHLRQRKIASQLACLLKIDKIPTANMNALVDRYCKELNLPEQVARLSKEVLRDSFPSATVPKAKRLFPSCEAWAMVSIIFILKLSFGLNDKTEIVMSRLASEVNSERTGDQLLFVFEEWQKYIECRKTVLSYYHYPTLEQLRASPFQNSQKFLNTMMKESKDEYRNDRFIPYSKYYIEEKLLTGVKQVLNALSKPQDVTLLDFQPSLTPQISHVKFLIRNLQGGNGGDERSPNQLPEFSKALLEQSFKNCDIEFAFYPTNYINLLREKNSNLFQKFGRDHYVPWNEHIPESNPNISVLMECSSAYWMLKYPNASSGLLGNFREDVFEKTPKNFQWLMTECARMLEMNVRDIYDELLSLEQKLSRKG